MSGGDNCPTCRAIAEIEREARLFIMEKAQAAGLRPHDTISIAVEALASFAAAWLNMPDAANFNPDVFFQQVAADVVQTATENRAKQLAGQIVGRA